MVWSLKCYIVDSFIGFFAYDEALKLVLSRAFDKADEAGKQLSDLEKSGTCTELEVLIHDLMDMGYDDFIFEDEQEAKAIKGKFRVPSQVFYPSQGGKAFRASINSAALASGIKVDKLDRMRKDVSEALVRVRVRVASEKRDRLVAQAVSGLDEIDKNVNITVSRVREWYGLHFPELDTLVPDHKQYMSIVSQYGYKASLDEAGVEAIVQNENKAKSICETAKASMGAEIAEQDMKQIRDLAEVTLKTYDARDAMEKYIDDTMKEVAPNMRELAGASLGARLIALAGSLENLARKPASTMQVLGAEKALFRSLKTGARPPKHGIIFQHQYLHNAERWQRGKIARALAGKLSIAARVDAYGGEYIAEALKANVEKRIAEIKKKYSKPPVREQRRDRFEGRPRFERRGDRGGFDRRAGGGFNRREDRGGGGFERRGGGGSGSFGGGSKFSSHDNRDRWSKKEGFGGGKKWRGNKRW
jgi:nucleolar protein 56